GLTGAYAVELRFAEPRSGAAPDAIGAPDDAPEFLTALREQLGLKLVPQRSKVPVLVIDHVERPTEN
ncbi:MAG TPA: TIGR03435 family protein, partial [Gemmatimonadaceae bacterium]|nr:TIGR03435 family protein [Gemmatimonadaceae bacterium]